MCHDDEEVLTRKVQRKSRIKKVVFLAAGGQLG